MNARMRDSGEPFGQAQRSLVVEIVELGQAGLDVRVDEQDAKAHVGDERADVRRQRRLADAALGTDDAENDHRTPLVKMMGVPWCLLIPLTPLPLPKPR
jgi:hypothetical protein